MTASRLLLVVRHVWHRPVLRNAGSLYGSTLVTSGLGFLFWLIAARLFTVSEVGIGSAVLSAGQLVAGVAIFGFGTLAIAELSSGEADRGTFLLTVTVASAALGALGGASVDLLIRELSPSLRPGFSGWLAMPVFIALSAFGTVAAVLDDAALGLWRGGIQLRRNTVFAVVKLALLPVGAVVSASAGMGLVLAWTAGLAISLLLSVQLFRVAGMQSSRIDFKGLLARRRLVYQHHWLNISVLAPSRLIPVVIATLVSPRANAGYYTCQLLVGFLSVIPAQLATALFAVRPGNSAELRREVRTSLGICAAVSVCGALTFGVGGHLLLELFSRRYAFATTALSIMGLSIFPSSIKAFYVAIARVNDRMAAAAWLTSATAITEVGAAIVGAYTGGLTGSVTALLAVYVLEVFLLGRSVHRAVKRDHPPTPESKIEGPLVGDQVGVIGENQTSVLGTARCFLHEPTSRAQRAPVDGGSDE